MLIVGTFMGATIGCSDPTAPCCSPADLMIRIETGPSEVRQGDVVSFGAVVTQDGSPSEVSVDWSVEPAGAGLIKVDGRFVAYRPGGATVVAEAQNVRAEKAITISLRGVSDRTFSVVVHGAVPIASTTQLQV